MQAAYQYWSNRDDDPCIVAPTGSGKSWIIARIVQDVVALWSGRVLVLSHVKELLQQNAEKIFRLCPETSVGLYSAGLKRRDSECPVVVAGIQSVYQRACELGPFEVVIIDEAHLVPSEGRGMYRRFLSEAKIVNPSLRCVGLTASPLRLDSGPIYGPDRIFGDICYEIGIRELIRDGYLCPLVTKAGTQKVDIGSLHVRGGEFIASEVEALVDRDEIVRAACAEIVRLTRNRNSVLIFAAGVNHGRHVQQVLRDLHGVEAGFVCGETPSAERDEVIARFRSESDGLFQRSPLKFLVNVNVCAVGFDAPAIDCIALLRPMASPVLYIQSVGRGLRVHPSKRETLVLDFGNNILRHGPIDLIQAPDPKAKGDGTAPAKECPQCCSIIAAGYAICPDCGYEFPPPERPQHDAKASDAGILSGQATDTEFEVRDVVYSVHTKRDAPEGAPKTMRVDYRLGLNYWVSEWVCFEHAGYARHKAEQWWGQRSPDAVPDTSDHAVELAEAGALAPIAAVTVRSIVGEPYDRIVGYKLGPKPEPVTVVPSELDPVDLPF